MTKTNSMNIREHFLAYNDMLDRENQNYQDKNKLGYVKKIFYSNFFAHNLNNVVETAYRGKVDEDKLDKIVKTFDTQTTLISILVINDLFLELNHDVISGDADNKDEKLLNTIKKALLTNNIKYLLIDMNNVLNFVNAPKKFYNMSAYEKITLFAFLNVEDFIILSKFNPFFQEEYEHYNVDINVAFIIKQINNWLKYQDDLDLALTNIAQFICDINYANSLKVKNIIEELLVYAANPEEIKKAIDAYDIKKIVPTLQLFYENNKNKELKNN